MFIYSVESYIRLTKEIFTNIWCLLGSSPSVNKKITKTAP